MLISVWCASCNQVTASTETTDPEAIGLLILSTHATQPHCHNHRLEARINGEAPPDGDHDLLVRCLFDGCNSTGGKEKHWKLPKWFASAAAIIFHASHEGHTLEAFLDGKRYALVE